jgi:hypothetical protein
MATVNSLTGGAFQDNEGNPLVNGYLQFQLNKDETVNTNTQVCSGKVIQIPLDSNGNIITSPTYSLWPNDVLLAVGSFYFVSAYTASGQLVWGPNCQSVLSSPSPFNLSSWIPGKV